MRNYRFGRKGQSIVLLTLALPALLGCVSLAVDIANLYFNWSRIRSATDAAVLAGAGYLPAFPDKAKSVAATYAQTNGVQSGEIVSTTVAEDKLSLSMTLSRTVPYSFARVLGLISAPVRVSATAGVQSVNEATGIVPFGLDYLTPVTFNSVVTLHMGIGPGNWDPLALGGNGANVFRDNVMYGYNGSITVGDSVLTWQYEGANENLHQLSDRPGRGQLSRRDFRRSRTQRSARDTGAGGRLREHRRKIRRSGPGFRPTMAGLR